LTPAALGIDLSRSAVPSYLSLRSGSTEPAPRLPTLHEVQHEIQNIDLHYGDDNFSSHLQYRFNWPHSTLATPSPTSARSAGHLAWPGL